jgi:hypothetical protein
MGVLVVIQEQRPDAGSLVPPSADGRTRVSRHHRRRHWCRDPSPCSRATGATTPPCCTPARSTHAARPPSSRISRVSLYRSAPTPSSSHYPPTPQPPLSPLITALTSLSASSSVACLSAAAHPNAPIACSVAFFHKSDATPFYSDIPGRPETQVGRWHAMRKRGDDEKALGGSELALLEENVDWERIWSRSAAGDALPASLRELRCVCTPPARVVREFISIKTGGHTHDRFPDRQRSSRSQSSIVIVVCACDPGWCPSPVQFYKLSLQTEARPLRVIYSLRDRAAIHAHLQRFSEIFWRRWPRSPRRSPPCHPNGLPRPARHNCAPQSNPVRPHFPHRPTPSLTFQMQIRE